MGRAKGMSRKARLLLFEVRSKGKESRMSMRSMLSFDQLYPPPVPICIGPVGMGQSSSVMLLQKNQIVTTDSMVNRVSNKAPLIFPLVAWHRCVLMT